MDRALLPGASGRFTGTRALRHLLVGGVPLSGGPLRELEHSVLGDAGSTARDSGGYCGCHPSRIGERRLLPGWSAHHHRLVGKKRDFDRGICQRALRQGDGLG